MNKLMECEIQKSRKVTGLWLSWNHDELKCTPLVGNSRIYNEQLTYSAVLLFRKHGLIQNLGIFENVPE